MDLEKWEAAKQLNVSGALQEFRQNPTPENGLNTHQQLIQFHQYEEAAALRQTLAVQFPGNAKLHCNFGYVLWSIGQYAEAEDHLKRALEIRPDMPEAKIGLARTWIRSGKLDEARQIQKFLEEPGAKELYSLETLETLALAYQGARRHEEAMELFKILLDELPQLANHAGFRKMVQRSEKAALRRESILPKRKFQWSQIFKGGPRQQVGGLVTGLRLAFFGGLALVLFGGVMTGMTFWKQAHRTVYIINENDTPALVSIDHQSPVKVSKGSPVKVLLAESLAHHAEIHGPVEQQFDFPIVTGFWDGWSNHPMWLMNVGGSALIVESHGTYSANPTPTTYSFHFGQPVEKLADIDFPFAPLPKSQSVEQGQTVTRTAFELVSKEPSGALQYLQGVKRNDEALNMAEWAAAKDPENSSLLEMYLGLGQIAGQTKRITPFLKTGLPHRPVLVQWHRAYQAFAIRDGVTPEEIEKMYTGFLEKEPNNSALLYLRGRLSNDRAEGTSYFKRALESDPQNAYAHYALGYDYFAQAKWDDALPLIRRAAELAPKEDLFNEIYISTLFAMGHASEVESLASSQLDAGTGTTLTAPHSPAPFEDLAESLLIQQRLDDAVKVENRLEQTLNRAEQNDLASSYHKGFLYKSGKMEELEKVCSKDRSPTGRYLLSIALIEQGRLNEAERIFPMERVQTPVISLARGSAFLLRKESNASASYLQQTCGQLVKGGRDEAKLGTLLQSATAPSIDDLSTLAVEPDLKATAAAWLALKYPEHAKEFASVAEKFNFRLAPPHYLVAKVINEIRK